MKNQAVKAVIVLVAVSLSASVIARPTPDATLTASSSSPVIYANGSITKAWTLTSYGVPVLDTNNTLIAKYRSPACVYAESNPFGSIIFQAVTQPFNATASILSVWLRGSVLTKAQITIGDSLNRRSSIPLHLQNLGKNQKISKQTTADVDGWQHIWINLGALTVNSSIPSDTNRDPNMWNQIQFTDISGTGFSLALDDMVLLPSFTNETTTNNTTCIGVACNPDISIDAIEPNLVPLYGGDISVSSITAPDGPIQLIARLATTNTTQITALSLCNELEGGADTAEIQRFQGSCVGVVRPPLTNTQDGVMLQAADVDDWPFITLTAQSPADLYAMRASLTDSVAYFEIDGRVTMIPVSPKFDDYADEVIIPQEESMYTNNNSTDASYSIAASCTSLPWGLDRIDQSTLPLNGAYSPGPLTGQGVHIFIIDTGIYSSSNEFTGRIGQGVNCVNSVCSTSGTTNDGNGHGTHVSGIAAGTCYGVAKQATIHPVKALADNGSGQYSGIVNALRWIKSDVQSKGYKAVVSMSLGGPSSQSVNDAIAELTGAGIPVAAAAGNDGGANACTTSPGGASSAITVGATDSSDRKASYSNVGSCLDIWAPGSAIKSAGISGPDSTSTMSGTSMATPYVAGTLALLQQPGAFGLGSVSQISEFLSRASVKLNLDGSSTQNFLQAACTTFCATAIANGASCRCG